MQSTRHAARVHPVPRVNRGVRVLRGSIGALLAASLAAASHGLAGGVITWTSVAATVVVTLPLCVALAGRVGSVWRLTLAVAMAQFMYHWTFAGLGLASGAGSGSDTAISPHAAHLAALQTFTPSLASAGAADAAMWVGHVIAAALTIALLYRGERAFVALGSALRRVLFTAPALLLTSFARALPRVSAAGGSSLRERLLSASAISRRGPPHFA